MDFLEPSLIDNLCTIKSRIYDAEITSGREVDGVRLVAVSKTKPSSAIQSLYDNGHRHFGENYVQELIEKAAVLPKDICWHFIGHLQSQKAKQLIREVPNLHVLETIDSEKLASKIENALASLDRPPLRVFIQVDTSNEDTKSGVTPGDLDILLNSIKSKCPHLIVAGLMTIGAPGDSSCFDKLAACRSAAALTLGVDELALELSMGMSEDFPQAIAKGSTSVRVGSLIFGSRVYAQRLDTSVVDPPIKSNDDENSK
jgi:PLP dependent protein